jgi:allantoinase
MIGDIDVRNLPYIRYMPMTSRPPIAWPGGARVAFWLALNVEVYEFQPPPNRYSSIYARGVPVPDVLTHSMLDYGNRIGFWRLMDLFDELGIPISVSLSMSAFEEVPEITDAIRSRDWSIFSHGIYNTRFLYGMSADESDQWIEQNVALYREYTGERLRGLFGPCISLSPHSMEAWSRAGIDYVVDWFMDDQPFPVEVQPMPLVNVPYSFDINDGLVMGSMPGRGGRWESDYFERICRDQLDTLRDEGERDGRVMCMSLHPFVSGHPARLPAIRRVLEYVKSHDDVWLTTAEAIADHYRVAHLDQALTWRLDEAERLDQQRD